MSKPLHLCLLAAILTVATPAAMAGENSDFSMGAKLGAGFANATLSFLELPKNMINTTNEVNFALGISGGVIKGCLHTMGRTLAGILDILTFPLPTEPIVNPSLVWEKYDVETHYNPIFKMKK